MTFHVPKDNDVVVDWLDACIQSMDFSAGHIWAQPLFGSVVNESPTLLTFKR